MTPIDKRKAELREYIEARKKATQGIWNAKMFFPASEDDYDFCDKAANESARIAEQLLECIEALEFNKKHWELVNPRFKHLAVWQCTDELLIKITGEK